MRGGTMGDGDTPAGNAPPPEPPRDPDAARVDELFDNLVDEQLKGEGAGGEGLPEPKQPPPPKSPPFDSDDPSEWTLKLRDDVRFSDGTTLEKPDAPEPDLPAASEDWSDGGPSAYEIKGELGAPKGAGGAQIARYAALAAGVIVAIVIGTVLAMGGGDDDATQPAEETTTARNPGGAAASGGTGDLAAAGLPTDLAYTATGRTTFRSTIRVNSTCTGTTCTYSSAFNPGAGLVRGPIPTVNWSHSGPSWRVVLTAPILSSSTNGADCVYLYTDTWDLTTQEAQAGGGLLRAVRLTGTLRRDIQMDPSRSQGVGVTCLPYTNTDTYAIVATPA